MAQQHNVSRLDCDGDLTIGAAVPTIVTVVFSTGEVAVVLVQAEAVTFGRQIVHTLFVRHVDGWWRIDLRGLSAVRIPQNESLCHRIGLCRGIATRLSRLSTINFYRVHGAAWRRTRGAIIFRRFEKLTWARRRRSQNRGQDSNGGDDQYQQLHHEISENGRPGNSICLQ